ncbi:MAG TPA: hypothetical protein VFN65_03350 [Solirubrobacteraceae bacterium]|nr:hypothetical protein [Solirubrobacteraceae bacterium]
MAELGIAIIGYGLAGRVFHAPLIAATDGLRVSAIVTSDQLLLAQAARASAAARTVVALP